METELWNDYFAALQISANYSIKQTYLKKTGAYPYRVAARFLEYLEIRGDQFTQSQKKQAKEIFAGWLSRIAELPPTFRKNHVVARAHERLAISHDFFD